MECAHHQFIVNLVDPIFKGQTRELVDHRGEWEYKPKYLKSP